jgi:GNAT superfamily N-acetyltransferase
MTQTSEDRYRPHLRSLWKTCFPADSDRFIDLYFNFVYKNDETLIRLVDDRPVSALQIIPYTLSIAGNHCQGGYLSGIMTHPDHRNRGYMNELMHAALHRMQKSGFAYSFLIPQREMLVALYARYGFRLCDANPHPPINRVLKTPAQWSIIQQDYLAETGILLPAEPPFPHEQKGMILRLLPTFPPITTLHMGMMLD